MKRHLTYKDEKSDKFWKIEVNENTHTVTYGKTGSSGTSKTKEFADNAAALKDAEKSLKAKLKKGYVESGSTTKTKEKKTTSKSIFTPPKDSNEFIVNLDNPIEAKSFMMWLADNVGDIETREGYSFYKEVNGKKVPYKKDKADKGGAYIDENIFGFFKEVTQQKELLPYLQEYVTSVDGEIWLDDESPLGIWAAYALALVDKKYLKDYAKYISTTDMNHEVHQSEQIDALFEKWGAIPEMLFVLATRCVFPSQHGDQQLGDFSEEANLKDSREQQSLFLNYLLLESKRYTRQSQSYHKAKSIIRCIEEIGIELPGGWNNTFCELIDNAKKTKPVDFSGLFYFLDVNAGKTPDFPKKIHDDIEFGYMDSIEQLIINGQYEKAEQLLLVLKMKGFISLYKVVKTFMHCIVNNFLGKDNKKQEKLFQRFLKEEIDLSRWTFEEINVWLKSDKKTTEEQKNYVRELLAKIIGEEPEIFYFLKREGSDTKKWTIEKKGNTLTHFETHNKNEEELEYKTEEKCLSALNKIIAEKKSHGYSTTVSPTEITLFKKAIKENDLGMIKQLIDKGIQLDMNSASFIETAMKNSRPEVLKYLLGELVENYENDGEWNLYTQLEYRSIENVKVLLASKYTPIPSDLSASKFYFLHQFTPETMELYMKKIPNWKDYDAGELASRCLEENLPLLDFLLKKGAKVNDSEGHSNLLINAIEKEMDISIIKKIVANGAWVNLKNLYDDESTGDKEFKELIKGIKNKEIKEYIQEVKDKQDNNFSIKKILSSTKAVQKYIDEGGDVNYQDEHGWSILHHSCCMIGEWISQPMAKILLENGTDPNLKDKKGRTAIFYLDYTNDADHGTASLFKKHGADLNVKDKDGLTAILYQMKQRPTYPNGMLCQVQNPEGRFDNAVINLLNSELDLNCTDENGDTPLHLIVNLRRPKNFIVKFLGSGANPNLKNKKGETILHMSIYHKDLNGITDHILPKLLAHTGIDLNIQDKDGNTALHLAGIHNKGRLAEKILAFPVDMTIKNKAGKTAKEIFEEEGMLKKEDLKLLVEDAESTEAKEEKWEALDLVDVPPATDINLFETKGYYPTFPSKMYDATIKVNKNHIIIDNRNFLSAQSGEEVFSKAIHSILNIEGHIIGHSEDYIVKINNETSEEIWKRKLNLHGLKIVSDFVIGSTSSTVYGLHLETGKIAWKYKQKKISKVIPYKNQLVITNKESDKSVILNSTTGQVEKNLKINDIYYDYVVVNGDQLSYLTELSRQEYALHQLDLLTGKTTTLKPPKGFFLDDTLFAVNGKLYIALSHSDDEKRGVFEVKRDGTFEFCISFVFVMRNKYVIGKECVYIQDGKQMIEMDLKKKTLRKINLRERIHTMCINNGQLLVLTRGPKESTSRLHVIV